LPSYIHDTNLGWIPTYRVIFFITQVATDAILEIHLLFSIANTVLEETPQPPQAGEIRGHRFYLMCFNPYGLYYNVWVWTVWEKWSGSKFFL